MHTLDHLPVNDPFRKVFTSTLANHGIFSTGYISRCASHVEEDFDRLESHESKPSVNGQPDGDLTVIWTWFQPIKYAMNKVLDEILRTGVMKLADGEQIPVHLAIGLEKNRIDSENNSRHPTGPYLGSGHGLRHLHIGYL